MGSFLICSGKKMTQSEETPLTFLGATTIRRPQPDTVRLNDHFWMCNRHVPAIRLPDAAHKCWMLGCTSTRPPKEIPEEPPPAAKRRGATQQVRCSHCGDLLWRRPREVAEGKQFFCGFECRRKASQGG